MGLFDLFGRKSGLEKHALRVANKRAQAPDRWESIQALGVLATAEPKGADERQQAVEALLERFTFHVDPTIIDGQEKDEAFRLVCKAGAIAIPAVRKALRKHETPSWALKVLEQLQSEPEVVGEILSVLEAMDTEYERDPQRKLQLLATLEDKRDSRIAPAVERFFRDVNEPARFHAMGAAILQGDDSVVSAIAAALQEEDSVRVTSRVLDLLAERGWSVGEAREALSKRLPPGYTIDKKGVPQRPKR